jgi:hypothetical protein
MPDATEVFIIIEPAIVGLDGVLLTGPAQHRDARNRSKSTRFHIAILRIGPQVTVGTASGVLSDGTGLANRNYPRNARNRVPNNAIAISSSRFTALSLRRDIEHRLNR